VDTLQNFRSKQPAGMTHDLAEINANLNQAVYCLATLPDDLRGRLPFAYLVLIGLSRTDFPEVLQEHFDWVMSQLTARKPRFTEETPAQASVVRRHSKTLAKIAQRIVYISNHWQSILLPVSGQSPQEGDAMTAPVDYSPSRFREARERRRFTLAQIAAALGVSLQWPRGWDRGNRPSARFMPGLAKFFEIDLAEAVKLFWNEILDSLCPCCGGEKFFPDNDRAIHLYTKRTCKGGCGDVKIYRHSCKHRAFCNSCGNFQRRGPRVPLKCGGYKLWRARRPRFACHGKSESTKRRAYLKYSAT